MKPGPLPRVVPVFVWTLVVFLSIASIGDAQGLEFARESQ